MQAPWDYIRTLLFAGITCTTCSTIAFGEVLVFECTFPDFSFFATIYDDDTPSRIGIARGVGDKAQSYFDEITGAWILVEFIDNGKLPSTLTTILKGGTVVHSRHTMSVDGLLIAQQLFGHCDRSTVR